MHLTWNNVIATSSRNLKNKELITKLLHQNPNVLRKVPNISKAFHFVTQLPWNTDEASVHVQHVCKLLEATVSGRNTPDASRNNVILHSRVKKRAKKAPPTAPNLTVFGEEATGIWFWWRGWRVCSSTHPPKIETFEEKIERELSCSTVISMPCDELCGCDNVNDHRLPYLKYQSRDLGVPALWKCGRIFHRLWRSIRSGDSPHKVGTERKIISSRFPEI